MEVERAEVWGFSGRKELKLEGGNASNEPQRTSKGFGPARYPVRTFASQKIAAVNRRKGNPTALDRVSTPILMTYANGYQSET
ncbi:hypothetical protein ACLOAV_003932 [Pseudogymnoascus australis]